MISTQRTLLPLLLAIGLLAACNGPSEKANHRTTPSKDTTTTSHKAAPDETVLTLPVLDALFYEKDFSASLKSQLGLSATQIEKLRTAAHASLRELSEDGIIDTAGVHAADQKYRQQIEAIIGADQLAPLAQLVKARYSKGMEGLAPTKPNFVPADTRIVVNAPAFRLDIFQDGKLLQTFKVGIGYPEFPLPTGMRRADTIIFRPSWTPPDEPWVKGKFSPGRKVSGADEDNPLGVVKIPIGLPSLIHGGKPLEKIGNFASHGCVGLTNGQVKAITPVIARLGGSELSDAQIAALMAQTKTKSIRLPSRVPVDLRYETIVAEDSSLHIYRDVYERGTNTIANARQVLAAWGVNYDQLTDQEKTDLDEALTEMNRDPRGRPIAAADSLAPGKNGVAATKQTRAKQGQTTRKIKGAKEATVVVAALKGKGYPAPVNLNNGR